VNAQYTDPSANREIAGRCYLITLFAGLASVFFEYGHPGLALLLAAAITDHAVRLIWFVVQGAA
jgi:hypothetical protein